MSKEIKTPSASMLNELFPVEACAMERAVVINQLRSLGIEYKITRKKHELVIDVPTTADGILQITPSEMGSPTNRRFFHSAPAQQMRLPGGKVLKSEPKEIVFATVDFISHGEHPNVTYLLKETNFAEVIDTAIESLAQIDGIYLSPIKKNRGRRGDNPNQPPLQD